MRSKVISLLFRIFFGKEAEEMMAMLWAQRIMSAKTVEECNKLRARAAKLTMLKDEINEILIESGREDLCV